MEPLSEERLQLALVNNKITEYICHTVNIRNMSQTHYDPEQYVSYVEDKIVWWCSDFLTHLNKDLNSLIDPLKAFKAVYKKVRVVVATNEQITEHSYLQEMFVPIRQLDSYSVLILKNDDYNYAIELLNLSQVGVVIGINDEYKFTIQNQPQWSIADND